jgi:hypothetical protein
MSIQNNLEKRKRLIRLISFLSTVILSSIAVMFTTFADSSMLLTIILLPCVVTLSVSMIPVPVSARNIIICAIISAVTSVAAVCYVLITQPETIRQYLAI